MENFTLSTEEIILLEHYPSAGRGPVPDGSGVPRVADKPRDRDDSTTPVIIESLSDDEPFCRARNGLKRTFRGSIGARSPACWQ